MPQIIIDLTPQQAQLLLEAFRAETNNPEATVLDIKKRIVDRLKVMVINYERNKTPLTTFEPN